MSTDKQTCPCETETTATGDVFTSTSSSGDGTSSPNSTINHDVSSALCSNCNSPSPYFAHLENCAHSFCGPCLLAWRRQALFNFVITCSTCGTPSRRAFPWPTTVNCLSERRQMADNFELVCRRNANCSKLKWLTSKVCLTLSLMALTYIAATLINWQTYSNKLA